ncbi:MAG: HlyC/CorC family transporter [Chloracidobacterium sp.]|nr:HlyC/CorC family transporter [Chloracidobacterium sp.]
MREILENRPRFRFALSSVIQVFLICVAVLVTVIVSEFIPTKLKLLVASLAISVTATVIVRQIIPRLIIRNDTEKKLLFLLPVIRPMYAFVSYFVDPIANRKRAKALQRLETTIAPDSAEDRADDNAEDFQALMEVGEAEGIIEEDERELIETMIDFGDTLAGEIMTPRTGIVGIAVGTSIKDARDVIIEEKYSRLPVYRDTIDNVEGMIYVRDLLAALATGQKENAVETIMRDAFFVPETKTASELLKSMQQNHVQIAVVIDEYGGVAGLVTVEDIIEEIVGEIEDEDTEQEEVIEIIEGEGGYYDVLGSTEIDKVERIFDIDLEDDDYTTIAGLVTSEAGYVPKVGDKLALKGPAIEILQADEKRITLLRLRKTDPPKTDEDADD